MKFFVILVFVVAISGIVGWFINLIDLFKLDFASPYKAEVLRTVGIFIPPMGAIEGLFVTFDEEVK